MNGLLGGVRQGTRGGTLGWYPEDSEDSGSQWEPRGKGRAGTLSHRRPGCCCKGYAWIAPRKTNLQFCLYW